MLPNISILIPTFNEEDFIKSCVESLITDSYPEDKIEVLIIDGGSSDKTRQIVRSLQQKHNNIRLLSNVKKIVPSAMNLGVQEASHSILVWCGSHATYEADYLKNSVETLLSEPNCASVGGVIIPTGDTPTGEAIAIATSNKFGIGNAHYRYASTRMYVDTVFGGCFYKSSVEKIGGFNEEWARNQDYEFNYRLRTQVGRIILDPSIRCNYYCRDSVKQLAKQYFSYGYWRFRTLRKHPKSITLRQMAPVALIVGLILSFALLMTGNYVGLIIPLCYFSVNLLASLMISNKEGNPKLLLELPLIFASIHLSWGCGFILNAVKTGYERLLNRHV